MADEKKTITLYIAQKPFRLSIPASQEEIYRKAERNIQDYVKQLANKSNITDPFTQIGYAVIKYAVRETQLSDKQQYIDTDLKEALDILNSTFDKILSK